MRLNAQCPGSTGSKHLFRGRDFCKGLITFSKALGYGWMDGWSCSMDKLIKTCLKCTFHIIQNDFFFLRKKQVHKVSPVPYLLRHVVSSCSGFFHLMSPYHPLLVIIKSALIWGTCLDEQQQCLGTSH